MSKLFRYAVSLALGVCLFIYIKFVRSMCTSRVNEEASVGAMVGA